MSRSRVAARIGITVVLVVGFLGVVGSSHGPAAALVTSGLGTNLGAVTYYDGVVPFADLVDQAGDWVSQRNGGEWGEGDPLSLRRDGWPASLADGQFATTVIAEVRYPAGTYAVSWSGLGTFDINGITFGSASVSGGSGSIALDGSTIVLLNLRTTDPADPLRAIDVRVPGEAADAVFRSSYLSQLAPYRVVRFMDWQRTNSTFLQPGRTFTCADRVLPGSFSQGTSMGVSAERMVELANRLGVDPWFTIPHEASADWIACHAQIVAANLNPGLTPRYEFSNETWNPQFRAFHELQSEGVDLGLGGGDPYLALQQRHARRHVEAMTTIAEAFETTGRTFIRVMAGQAANVWVLDSRLETDGAAAVTDEIAVAPYLHVNGRDLFVATDAAEVARWTQSELFTNLAVAQTDEVDAWTSDHMALAGRWSKRFVAYEGGQHLAGDPSNEALTALLTAANRSAAMTSTYTTYLDHWRRLTGGALFVHFTDVGPYSQFGSWGALEYPEQGASPKYAALLAYAGGAPPPTPDGGSFVGVTPTRALDTRESGVCVGRSGRSLSIAGSFGVPVDAVAVSLNVTVVGPAADGFVTVWPAGRSMPVASNLNFVAGQVVPNMVQVGLGADGAIGLYSNNGCPHLVVDIAGYYVGGRVTDVERRASRTVRSDDEDHPTAPTRG